MKTYEILANILIDILDKDMSFNVALKNTFKNTNVKNEEKNAITQLIGCELRHHFIFKELVRRTFGDLENKSAAGMYLAMANIRFLKKYNDDELVAFAKQVLDENNVGYEPDVFDAFFSEIKTRENLIPADIQPQSIEFLSYRYNVPTFLVKMWQKNVGRSLTYKILKALSKPGMKVYRVNTLKTDFEKFASENKEQFSPTEVPETLLYQGKNSSQKIDAINDFTLFAMPLAQKLVVDNVELDPLKRIAVLSNFSNNIYIEIGVKHKNAIPVDVITSSGKDYFNMTRTYHKIGLENMRFYHCPVSSIVTCISSPVHTFFVLPNNSRFSMLRSTPDYAIHFKQSKLDELIKEENETLEECSKFVESGGQLVYIIPTFSYKESRNVITNFLKSHPDFSLIDEKQFLPLDAYDSMLYYAIIKKAETVKND